MGSKNKAQYVSLPNLYSVSNPDSVYSKRNINNLMSQRVHSVTLYRDHASNVFNEDIQKYSNAKVYICKRSYSQLGAKPRSQCRASINVSHRIQRKGSKKHDSTLHNTVFKTQSTFCGKDDRMLQTKRIETSKGGKGRLNCRMKSLK